MRVNLIIFWVCGCFFTAKNIFRSYIDYTSYPYIIQTTETVHGKSKLRDVITKLYTELSDKTFPIILLCSNSMHSKDRLERYQGNSGINFEAGTLNQTIIEGLSRTTLRS